MVTTSPVLHPARCAQDDYFWEVAPTLNARLEAAGLRARGKRLIESNKHMVVLAEKPAA